MRAMYTENSSKQLIFPLPISSDRQLGGLRSGEGRLRGTTGRAQETAAVFPDTHTVVLQSGGQHCWISQEASPGSPQVRIERNQPWSHGLPRPCYPYPVPHQPIWAQNYRRQPLWLTGLHSLVACLRRTKLPSLTPDTDTHMLPRVHTKRGRDTG